MQRSEIRDRVRLMLNQPSTPTNYSLQDADIDKYINMVQDMVQGSIVEASEDYFATTVDIAVTVALGETYALPTDCLKITAVERVYGTTLIPIEPIPYAQKEEYRPVTNIGYIQYYYLFGEKIGFIPYVESTVTLSYIQRVTEMAEDATVSSIPLQYHNSLVLGAAWLASFQLQQTRTDIKSAYDEELARLNRQIENRIEHRARWVVITPP